MTWLLRAGNIWKFFHALSAAWAVTAWILGPLCRVVASSPRLKEERHRHHFRWAGRQKHVWPHCYKLCNNKLLTLVYFGSSVLEGVMGWTVFLQNPYVQDLSGPQNVTSHFLLMSLVNLECSGPLIQYDLCPFKKAKFGHRRTPRENTVKTEAEIKVMFPLVKGCRRLPMKSQSWERGLGQTSLVALGRKRPAQHLSLGLLTFTTWDSKLLLFKLPVVLYCVTAALEDYYRWFLVSLYFAQQFLHFWQSTWISLKMTKNRFIECNNFYVP